MDGSPRDAPGADSGIEFEQKFRGYDPEQVDAHLNSVRAEMNRLERQLRDAAERAERAERAARRTASAEPRRAESRSDEGERNLGNLHDPEGAVQRTLAIAQRTADEVVREAQIESQQLIADAERASDQLQREAKRRSDVVREESAREARRVAEATRQPLIDEIRQLEAIRDELQRDVALLERHLTLQRSQLSASLDRLQQLVDDPEAFRIDQAPGVSGARLPQLVDYGQQIGQLLEQSDPERTSEEPSFSAVGARPAPSDDEGDRSDIGIDEHELAPEATVEPGEDTADSEASDEEAAPIGASVTDLARAREEVLVEAAEPLPEPEPVTPFQGWEPDEGVDEISHDLFDEDVEDGDESSSGQSDQLDDETAWEGTSTDAFDHPAPHLTGEPSWGSEVVGGGEGDPPSSERGTIFDRETGQGEQTESVALIDELLGSFDEGDEGDEGSDRFLAELRRASADEFGPPTEEADEAMSRFFDQESEEKKGRSRFGRRS